MMRLRYVIPAALIAALALPALAGPPPSADVSVEAPAPARTGELLKVLFRVTPAPGCHVYPPGSKDGIPFSVALAPGAPLAAEGELSGPPPAKHFDKDLGQEVAYYEAPATLVQAFRVPKDTKPGVLVLKGTYQGQVCNEQLCLPIPETPWEVQVTVEAGEARPDRMGGQVVAPADPKREEPKDDVRKALDEGLWALLATAVGAGLLTLLTPCVFPMIPVTISFFTKQASTTRSGAVKAAGAYALGIILIYTSLGLGLSVFMHSADAANRFGAHWAVNAFIATVFVVFAFSLFGAFELTLPSWVMGAATGTRSTTLPGILFLGLTFSLTSFTCSVQFVGVILAIAAAGAWFWPVVGLLAFSTTLAAPFFFLALFPQALKGLPQRGGWLNSVKVVMGFVELAAAFKFISSVDLYFHQGEPWLPRSTILVVWIVIAGATGLYLLGKIRLPHDDAVESIGAGRMVLALFFLAFGGYLCLGLGGEGLPAVDAWLPPRAAWDQVSKLANYEEALKQAKESRRPVWLSFTGYT